MKTISLSRGYKTLVDDADFERFGNLKWSYSSGYAMRSTWEGKKRTVYLHRLIAGAGEGEVVHHRNENTLDNTKDNLQIKTKGAHAVDHMMGRGARTGRFKGVYFRKHKGKWAAQLTVDGITCSLGCYITEEDAARAYDTIARRVWGENAHLNFPV